LIKTSREAGFFVHDNREKAFGNQYFMFARRRCALRRLACEKRKAHVAALLFEQKYDRMVGRKRGEQ